SAASYRLSLHDALPIFDAVLLHEGEALGDVLLLHGLAAGVLGRAGVDHERGRAVADGLLRRIEQALVGEGHMGTDLHAHAPHGLCSPRRRDGLPGQRAEAGPSSNRPSMGIPFKTASSRTLSKCSTGTPRWLMTCSMPGTPPGHGRASRVRPAGQRSESGQLPRLA